MNIKGRLYILIMKIAHRYNWHYAPPIYPEGDTQLWCKWCGFRQTIKMSGEYLKGNEDILVQKKELNILKKGLKDIENTIHHEISTYTPENVHPKELIEFLKITRKWILDILK